MEEDIETVEYSDEEIDVFWNEWLIFTKSHGSYGESYYLREKEFNVISWLAKISRNDAKEIEEIILAKRRGLPLYKKSYRVKKDGSRRKILSPIPSLKKIQKNLNKHVLTFLSVQENIYGFSGGNTIDAIRPHLGGKSMLRVDFKSAFPTVTYWDINYYFSHGVNVYGPKKMKEDGRGHFSWYTARIFSQLMTWNRHLPQGAPTSPRVFDLVCSPIDVRLSRLAKNVGGVYTRYADNILFSMPTTEFPDKIRQAILKNVEGMRSFYETRRQRRPGPKFKWHKLKIGKIEGKMLGYTVRNGETHNTRFFKRRVRKAIHHVNWLLNNEMDYAEAWQKLKGMMSYATKETFPQRLLNDYEQLKSQIC